MDKLKKLDIHIHTSLPYVEDVTDDVRNAIEDYSAPDEPTDLKTISLDLQVNYENMNFFIKYISKLMPEVENLYIERYCDVRCLGIIKLFPKLRKVYSNEKGAKLARLKSVIAKWNP